MKNEIKEVAKEAGFIFWEGENWAPKNQTIDWATDYDKELEKFAELMVNKCLKFVEVGRDKQETKDLILTCFDMSKKEVVKKKLKDK